MTIHAEPTVPAADPFTDEELTELALAANPDTPIDADAVSLWDLTGDRPEARLPEWYMPPVTGRLVHGWRRRVVLLIIVSFLLIDAYGLCNTYGWVHFG